MPRPRESAGVSTGLLVLRVVLGVVMFLHGWQKLQGPGLSGMTTQFTDLGAPLPQITGPLTLIAELVGGPLLVLGLATRFVALALAAVMAGAIALVHGQNGFFAKDGGYEYVLVLLAACVLFVLAGAGRISIDSFFRRGQREADLLDYERRVDSPLS